jgi:hypothetical protein
MKRKTIYGIGLVGLIVGHIECKPIKSQEFFYPRVGRVSMVPRKNDTTLQAWVGSSLDVPKSLSK